MAGPSRPLLVAGGRVLTLAAGDVREARLDVLVEGERITRVAEGIAAPPGCEVIDARDSLVLPGFVDTHRHTWQTQLRTAATDWTLFDYTLRMRLILGGFYEAEDVFLGNLVGALEAIDAGITTLVDHCHVLHTPEHADAALEGLLASGIRAVFCYGTFPAPAHLGQRAPEATRWRHADVARLRRDRLCGEEGLVQLGLAPTEVEAFPIEETAAEIRLARELGARRISCHAAMGAYDQGRRFVERLAALGLLGEDLLIVHGAALGDHELALLRDHGASISVTPETELQMGMGFPVARRALLAGVQTSLGIDIVSNFAGDMFAQMRLALQALRAVANDETQRAGRAPRRIPWRAEEVLRLATMGGAAAAGLGQRTGSLEPGKLADLIVVRTDSIRMTPAVDPVGAIVLYASPADVDTVVVGGVVRKRGGRLMDVDWPALRARLLASSEQIRSRAARLDPGALEALATRAFPNLEA